MPVTRGHNSSKRQGERQRKTRRRRSVARQLTGTVAVAGAVRVLQV